MHTLLNFRKIILLLFVISAGWLTGCEPNYSVGPEDEPPFVIGEITEIEEGENNDRYWIKVVAESWADYIDFNADFVWFGVTDNTGVFKQAENRTLTKLTADDLGVGQKVKGWSAGNVIRDLYPRGRAAYIVVIE
jgi:hypothetical protein